MKIFERWWNISSRIACPKLQRKHWATFRTSQSISTASPISISNGKNLKTCKIMIGPLYRPKIGHLHLMKRKGWTLPRRVQLFLLTTSAGEVRGITSSHSATFLPRKAAVDCVVEQLRPLVVSCDRVFGRYDPCAREQLILLHVPCLPAPHDALIGCLVGSGKLTSGMEDAELVRKNIWDSSFFRAGKKGFAFSSTRERVPNHNLSDGTLAQQKQTTCVRYSGGKQKILVVYFY